MSAILAGITDDRLILTETRTYKLWESAGKKIVEAQLTADQISQIFQTVQQDMTAAGGNRTMVGKGMDAASAVNKAWEDLKTKVQNSGPIKNVDAMYDQAAEKLKQATGGDQGVMKYVQMYRDFAKKHPIAQSLIYSALIAAAGISGAGLGGAAALGLFKMVDKLLQGEKFSSAAYSGAKTGAMAYGASKVGDLIKGKPEATPTSSGTGDSYTSYAPPTNPDGSLMTPQQIAAAKDSLRQGAGNAAYSATSDFASDPSTPKALQGIAKLLDADKPLSQEQLQGLSNFVNKFGVFQGGMTNPDGTASELMRQFTSANGMLNKALTLSGKSGGLKENKTLTIKQINLIFEEVSNYRLNEGIWDTIKGAAGKAVDYAKTKGQNLTTKVTSDKLMQAWKKAGSPTDSQQIIALLTKNGVAQEIINSVFSKLKISTAPTAPAPATAPATKTAAPASSISQGVAQATTKIPGTTSNINYKNLTGTSPYKFAESAENQDNLQFAFKQAKDITKQIKYDNTVRQIITEIELLAEKNHIDKDSLETAIQDVITAQRQLEAAVYGLDGVFEEAMRQAQFSEDLNEADLVENIKPDELADALLNKHPNLVRRYGHEVVVKTIFNVLKNSTEQDIDILIDKIIELLKSSEHKTDEGQIYSTGGGAGEPLHKYRIKPAGT